MRHVIFRLGVVIRAVTAAVVLTLLLGGPPSLLIILTGSPVIHAEQAWSAVQAGLVLATVFHTLVLAGWLWWITLVMDVAQAAKSVRQERGLIGGEAREGPPRRGGIRALISGLLIAPRAAPASVLTAVAAPPWSISITYPGAETASPVAAPAGVAARMASNEKIVRPYIEVRVRALDSSSTLWGLAERYLGEGTRWPQIWALNEGRQQADGSMMDSPGLLRPGWTVLVPQDAQPWAPGQGSESIVRHAHYTIARGDRLGDVSARFFGNVGDYRRIQQANGPDIPDPDHIETGEIIDLPVGARDHGTRQHAQGTSTAEPSRSKPYRAKRSPSEASKPPRPRSASRPHPEPTPTALLSGDSRPSEGEQFPLWTLPGAGILFIVALLVRIKVRRKYSQGRRRRKNLGPGEENTPRTAPAEGAGAGQSGVNHSPNTNTDNGQPEGTDRDAPDAAVERARSLIHSYTDALPAGEARHSVLLAPAVRPRSRLTARAGCPEIHSETEALDVEETGRPGSGGDFSADVARLRDQEIKTEQSEGDDLAIIEPVARMDDPAVRSVARSEPRPEKSAAKLHPNRSAAVAAANAHPQRRSPMALQGSSDHRQGLSVLIGDQPRPSQGRPRSSAAASAPVRVRLFGKPAVLDENGNAVEGLRKHAGQILLYLALHPEGSEINALMEVIWPDATLVRASARLSTELANLRRTVRKAAGQENNKRLDAVINTGGHYQLADFLDIDVWSFTRACAEAIEHPSRREKALARAVKVNAGRLSDDAGSDYPWLRHHRRRLLRAAVQVRLWLAETIRDTQPQQALAVLEEAEELDVGDAQLREQIILAIEQLHP